MARSATLARFCTILFLLGLAALRAQATAAATGRIPGLKVTYAPGDPDQKRKEGVHSYRARVLSLCVERGETPTPMIAPGWFEATFRGVLPLTVRDRYRFRVEGKGSFELQINGEKVLDGKLRPGKAEETAQPVRLKKGDNDVVLRIESAAVGDAQVRLLWSSSDFAFEPIGPELWQWPADDAEIAQGERLRRGQQVFVERRCIRCHRPELPVDSAYGEFDQVGPDLRSVGGRLQPTFLVEWLRDPRQVRADATMPRFRAEKDSDYRDLAAWLQTLGQPLAEPDVPAGAVERGAGRFLELGCIACHVPPEQTATAANLHGRMPLAFVPRKWQRVALETYLAHPDRDQAHSRMPDFRLDGDDSKVLAAYLMKDRKPSGPPVQGDADAGRRLAQRHGCDRCHALPLPESGRTIRALEGYHDDHGCLAATADGAGDAPDPGIPADDLAALRAFLPRALEAGGRRAPMDFAARMLPALRCTACHGMDGRASVWAQLAADMSQDEPLPPEQDPIAQGIPALTWVGSKLQPSWMESFVTGKEPSPRPWLHARMPTFAAAGPFVVAGLVRSHGYASADEPEAAPDAQLAVHGARLVKIGEGFGCVQCHGVGAAPPVQVFERQGINFAVAAKRLRRDYYMRWLLDPMRIDPDARMPKFGDDKGKTAFTDVLDGDARRQFDAIWNWFRTLK